MSTVLFTTGLCESEAEYASLMQAEHNFLAGHLPIGTNIIMNRWDHQTPALPAAPEKLVFVGFSFGGQKAIEDAANLTGRTVAGLVLIDPVNFHDPGQPNNNGFNITGNVLRAWCFYRQAQQMPWSSFIRSAACEFYNKRYVPKPVIVPSYITDPAKRAAYLVAAQHGEYVWSGEMISAIKAVL